jgi:mannosyltransferase OCH1-like enzyme
MPIHLPATIFAGHGRWAGEWALDNWHLNASPYNLLKEVFQRLKRKHMHLILLSATIFATTYWTFFFWVTIIKTLQLYAAGDDIYNAIHLETPETKGNASAVHIPRIIHRMWANDEFIKRDNLEITQSFIRCNSLYHRKNWTTILWTDESIRNFLQKHYSHSHFISTFDAYPYTIQRVDAARYFILYHYGGVYMDMDIGCFSTKDIGDFVNYMEASGKQVALPQTEPVGLSNDVMIAS